MLHQGLHQGRYGVLPRHNRGCEPKRAGLLRRNRADAGNRHAPGELCSVFFAAFAVSKLKKRVHPIIIVLLSGLLGVLIYGVF